MRPEADSANLLPLALANGSSNPTFHKAPISNVLNGSSHETPTSNGTAQPYTNGTTSRSVESKLPTFFGHDREEVCRIMIQALSDLGYQSTAGALSRESGYDLETPYAAAFRAAVLQGNWAEVESLLNGTYLHEEVGGVEITSDFGTRNREDRQGAVQRLSWANSPRTGGLSLAPDVDKDEMLFLIRQQKYLELLERRELAPALMVLRQELQPLHQEEQRLHSLSSLIMCQSSDDLKYQANWDGALGQSRKQLLSELSKSISPSAMIPEHRLAQLLHQVKEYQVLNQPYDNTRESPSLYTDYTAARANFPLTEVRELTQHKDEVWYLQFSNDGTRLATASKDKTVIIWNTKDFQPIHTLSSHRAECAFVAWSPDDSRIITCSQDKQARIWDTTSGLCLRTLSPNKEPVTTAAWAPDGLTCVTGTLDQTSSLLQWNTSDLSQSSDPIHTFDLAVRVQGCAISAVYPEHSADSPYSYDSLIVNPYQPDGVLPVRLVVISTEREIFIYDYLRREKIGMIDMVNKLTSVCLSRDGREMLVNVDCGEVWALGVEERGSGKVKQIFRGQEQNQFVIRSCFGGAREGIVISGSEDSRICIWHRHSGRLLEHLQGHTVGCVNAVAWNNATSSMFASAGDDRKVKIWAKANIQRDQEPPQLGPLPHWDTFIRGDGGGGDSLSD